MCDRGWAAVLDESSVSGSGPAAWVVALGWEPESGRELELELGLESGPTRPWAVGLRSGQSRGHALQPAIR